MLKRGLILGSFAFLMACTGLNGVAITQSPIDVRFQDGFEPRPISKIDLVTVRTFVAGNKEMAGANCLASGTGFTARFNSPAVLRLPLHLGRTDDVLIQCGGLGKSGQFRLNAKNLSAPDGEGITIGTGTAGTNISAVFSIRNKALDRFDYDNLVRINLR